MLTLYLTHIYLNSTSIKVRMHFRKIKGHLCQVKDYWSERRIDGGENLHVKGLCSCHEAALHGPCEHLYAALIHQDEPALSVRKCMSSSARKPGRPSKAKETPQRPVGEIVPGPSVRSVSEEASAVDWVST